MTNKECVSYIAVLKYIEKHVFKLEPTMFMADFEPGLRKAINIVYPKAELHGCFFHYRSAVRAKFMKLKLNKLVKRNPDARQIYQMLSHLVLLPTDNILEGYAHIVAKSHVTGLNQSLQGIFRYYKDYWLRLVRFCFRAYF